MPTKIIYREGKELLARLKTIVYNGRKRLVWVAEYHGKKFFQAYKRLKRGRRWR